MSDEALVREPEPIERVRARLEALVMANAAPRCGVSSSRRLHRSNPPGREGALPIIPSRRNAIKQAYCPKRFYRQRHKIENFFCRIKDWRRIATRYDKLARNFLAAATLIGALYWIKL